MLVEVEADGLEDLETEMDMEAQVEVLTLEM